MPRGSLSFQASPGGLLVPVGCPVLSVWPWRALLSCFVLSCCVFSPGGLLIPPNFPRENLGGGYKSSGCRGRAERTEAKAPKTICHGLQSSQLRHGLQSSQLHHGLLSSLHRHGLQSCQLAMASELSVPLWRSPSCVPVRVCLEGPPERPPPSPMELLRLGTSLSGGGSYVSPLSCVCHVFPPLVSIFGLFPVLVKCHYELILVQPCLSNYL